MRKGSKGKNEEEIEQELKDICCVLKNVSWKRIFQIESENKLKTRLIKDLSLSIITEKKLLSKIRQEFGNKFIQKMKKMIEDLDESKVELEKYKINSNHKGLPNGINFNVKILSESAWVIRYSDREKIEIPKFLKFCIDDFEKYFSNRYQNRKLVWCLGLSKMKIQFLYLKDKYTSISTLIQLLALLLLEKYGDLTLQKISDLLGCSLEKVIDDIDGLIFNPSFNPKGQINEGVILADILQKQKNLKVVLKLVLI